MIQSLPSLSALPPTIVISLRSLRETSGKLVLAMRTGVSVVPDPILLSHVPATSVTFYLSICAQTSPYLHSIGRQSLGSSIIQDTISRIGSHAEMPRRAKRGELGDGRRSNTTDMIRLVRPPGLEHLMRATDGPARCTVTGDRSGLHARCLCF